MAKPTAVIPKAPEIPSGAAERQELQRKLSEAPVEHAAAILEAYELMQALHDRGTLDMLRGLVGAGDDIIERVSSGLNTPEAIRGMRNLIVLAKIAGSLDPELLRSVSAGLSEATEKIGKAKSEKPPSLWSILKRMRSANTRRALAAAADVLDSVGKHLKSEPTRTAD